MTASDVQSLVRDSFHQGYKILVLTDIIGRELVNINFDDTPPSEIQFDEPSNTMIVTDLNAQVEDAIGNMMPGTYIVQKCLKLDAVEKWMRVKPKNIITQPTIVHN